MPSKKEREEAYRREEAELEAKIRARALPVEQDPAIAIRDGETILDPDAAFAGATQPQSADELEAFGQLEAQAPAPPEPFSRDGKDFYVDPSGGMHTVDAGFDAATQYPGLKPATAEQVHERDIQKRSGSGWDRLSTAVETSAATLANIPGGVQQMATLHDPRYELDRRPDPSIIQGEDIAPFAFTDEAVERREANPKTAMAAALITDLASSLAIRGVPLGATATAAELEAATVGRSLRSAIAGGISGAAGDQAVSGEPFKPGDVLTYSLINGVLDGVTSIEWGQLMRKAGKRRSAVDAAVENAKRGGVADTLNETDQVRKARLRQENAEALFDRHQGDLDTAMDAIDERVVSAPEKMFVGGALKRSVSNNAAAQGQAVTDLALKLDQAAQVTGHIAAREAANVLGVAAEQGASGPALFTALRQARKILSDAPELAQVLGEGNPSPLIDEVTQALDDALHNEGVWGRAAKNHKSFSGGPPKRPAAVNVSDIGTNTAAREELDAYLAEAHRRATATGDKVLLKHVTDARKTIDEASAVTGATLLGRIGQAAAKLAQDKASKAGDHFGKLAGGAIGGAIGGLPGVAVGTAIGSAVGDLAGPYVARAVDKVAQKLGNRWTRRMWKEAGEAAKRNKAKIATGAGLLALGAATGDNEEAGAAAATVGLLAFFLPKGGRARFTKELGHALSGISARERMNLRTATMRTADEADEMLFKFARGDRTAFDQPQTVQDAQLGVREAEYRQLAGLGDDEPLPDAVKHALLTDLQARNAALIENDGGLLRQAQPGRIEALPAVEQAPREAPAKAVERTEAALREGDMPRAAKNRLRQFVEQMPAFIQNLEGEASKFRRGDFDTPWTERDIVYNTLGHFQKGFEEAVGRRVNPRETAYAEARLLAAADDLTRTRRESAAGHRRDQMEVIEGGPLLDRLQREVDAARAKVPTTSEMPYGASTTLDQQKQRLADQINESGETWTEAELDRLAKEHGNTWLRRVDRDFGYSFEDRKPNAVALAAAELRHEAHKAYATRGEVTLPPEAQTVLDQLVDYIKREETGIQSRSVGNHHLISRAAGTFSNEFEGRVGRPPTTAEVNHAREAIKNAVEERLQRHRLRVVEGGAPPVAGEAQPVDALAERVRAAESALEAARAALPSGAFPTNNLRINGLNDLTTSEALWRELNSREPLAERLADWDMHLSAFRDTMANRGRMPRPGVTPRPMPPAEEAYLSALREHARAVIEAEAVDPTARPTSAGQASPGQTSAGRDFRRLGLPEPTQGEVPIQMKLGLPPPEPPVRIVGEAARLPSDERARLTQRRQAATAALRDEDMPQEALENLRRMQAHFRTLDTRTWTDAVLMQGVGSHLRGWVNDFTSHFGEYPSAQAREYVAATLEGFLKHLRAEQLQSQPLSVAERSHSARAALREGDMPEAMSHYLEERHGQLRQGIDADTPREEIDERARHALEDFHDKFVVTHNREPNARERAHAEASLLHEGVDRWTTETSYRDRIRREEAARKAEVKAARVRAAAEEDRIASLMEGLDLPDAEQQGLVRKAEAAIRMLNQERGYTIERGVADLRAIHPVDDVLEQISKSHELSPGEEIYLRDQLGQSVPNAERWIEDAISDIAHADEWYPGDRDRIDDLDLDDIIRLIERGNRNAGTVGKNRPMTPWEEFHVRREFADNQSSYESSYESDVSERRRQRQEAYDDENPPDSEDEPPDSDDYNERRGGGYYGGTAHGLPTTDELKDLGLTELHVMDPRGVQQVFGQALTLKDIEDVLALPILSDYAARTGDDVTTKLVVSQNRVTYEVRDDGLSIDRVYDANPDGFTVYHSQLFLPDSEQGSGMGSDIIRGMFEGYERLGASVVNVSCADIGKYYWPFLGFQPHAGAQRSAIERFIGEGNTAYLSAHGLVLPEPVVQHLQASIKNIRDLADATVPLSSVERHLERLEQTYRGAVRKPLDFDEIFVRGKGKNPREDPDARFKLGKHFLLSVQGQWNSSLTLKIDPGDSWYRDALKRMGALGLSAISAKQFWDTFGSTEQNVRLGPVEDDENETTAPVHQPLSQSAERDAANAATTTKLEYLQTQARSAVNGTARALTTPTQNVRTVPVVPGVTQSAGVAQFVGDAGNLRLAYAQKKETLQRIQREPMALVDEMADGLGELDDAAPEVHRQVVAKTFEVVKYLNDKLPTTIGASLTRPDGTPPSDFALKQFALYYSAATNPSSVYADLANNRARKEQMDALQTVWPDLYTGLKTEVVAQLADSRPTVQQRARLDLLFNFGDALTRAFSGRLVASLNEYRGAKGGPGGPPGAQGGPQKAAPTRRTNPSITASSATSTLQRGPAAPV